MYQRYNCYSRTVCNNQDSYSVFPSSTEYSNYLKAYGEVLADLIKDKDTNFKEINPHYLNDKDLLEKYVLYIHKDDIPSGDDKGVPENDRDREIDAQGIDDGRPWPAV